MRAVAMEMVTSAPDVIVSTSTLMAMFVSQQTRTTPIVLAGAGEPAIRRWEFPTA